MPSLGRRVPRVVAGALAVLLAPAPLLAQPGLSAEREALAKTQPTRPEALGGSPRRDVVALRLRFYADDEHRSGAVSVPDRLQQTLESVNEVVGPALGIRFVIESVRNWSRKGTSGRLDPVLAELERLDSGRDVDWVVGLVGALPQGSSDIHDVGIARTLGQHFVMRSLSSHVERSAFQRAFPALERSNPAELHLSYQRRKEHKEIVIFLHEWAHTLGALHVTDRTRMLFPTYAPDASTLGPIDLGLLAAALEDHLAARSGGARAAAGPQAQPDLAWSSLRRFLQVTSTPEWNSADRDKLIATLEASRGAGQPPAPAVGLSQGDAQLYERAFALYRARKDAAAWQTLAPLLAARPQSPRIQPLVCRLSALPAARSAGAAACSAGIARADADNAGPFVDAAQAAIAREVRDEALAHVREAAVRAGRAGPDATSAWLAITQLYTQLGALSWADEALARAGTGAGVDSARQQILRARRLLGFPAAPAIAPEHQEAYARAFRAAQAALTARKLALAGRLIESGLQRFAHPPGLTTLACDLAMRQGRRAQAQQRCQAALAAREDLPHAHYLLGHLQLMNNQAAAAATSFRRAVTLDPGVPAYWDRLAETYELLGRGKDLRALATEKARALAAATEP